jgi:hypothetical protein
MTTTMSKTATKKAAAALTKQINAAQKQLDSLRSRRDGGGGYGMGPDGKPTICQQLVDEMYELGTARRRLLGIPDWA